MHRYHMVSQTFAAFLSSTAISQWALDVEPDDQRAEVLPEDILRTRVIKTTVGRRITKHGNYVLDLKVLLLQGASKAWRSRQATKPEQGSECKAWRSRQALSLPQQELKGKVTASLLLLLLLPMNPLPSPLSPCDTWPAREAHVYVQEMLADKLWLGGPALPAP